MNEQTVTESTATRDPSLERALLNHTRAQSIEVLGEAMRRDVKKPKGALLKLYLENFKALNSTFGREYADALLEEILRWLVEGLGAEIIRTIGVEFVVVLKEVGYSQALAASEVISGRFENVWRIQGVDCLCSVYQAIVFYPDAGDDPEQLLGLLDQSLSEALRQGAVEAVVYDSTLAERLERRRRIALSLREAVDSDACELRYRPTYCQTEGRFTRAESYLRVFVPGIGPVGEAEFLPIAEESGQVCAVQRWAVEQICRLIRTLLDAGCVFESVAVPVSAPLLLQEGILEEIRDMMERYQVPPCKLALELTETALLTTSLGINIILQELSEIGVEMVLSDFGTGYSGINNILSLPVDAVKLERLFVWQLETNEPSGVLIEGLISIAHKLGLKLIAEGVETDNQVAQLNRYGCRYRQGFYYSATVEETELAELLKPGRGK